MRDLGRVREKIRRSCAIGPGPPKRFKRSTKLARASSRVSLSTEPGHIIGAVPETRVSLDEFVTSLSSLPGSSVPLTIRASLDPKLHSFPLGMFAEESFKIIRHSRTRALHGHSFRLPPLAGFQTVPTSSRPADRSQGIWSANSRCRSMRWPLVSADFGQPLVARRTTSTFSCDMARSVSRCDAVAARSTVERSGDF